MVYDLTPEASEAIFGWNSPSRLAANQSETEPATGTRKSGFCPQWIEDLCAIQDLFQVEGTDGSLTPLDINEVDYRRVVPYAQQLAKHVLATVPAGSEQHNVATALIGWIDRKPEQGRAWNIKSAALQLAEMVERYSLADPPTSKSVEDEIPF